MEYIQALNLETKEIVFGAEICTDTGVLYVFPFITNDVKSVTVYNEQDISKFFLIFPEIKEE